MEKLNYFNYCALAALLLVAVTVWFRGLLNSKRDRIFWYVILTALASVAFDIWAVTFDNSRNTNLMLRYVTHAGYLVLHNFSTPIYIIYLIELMDTWHKLLRNRLQMAIFALPFLCVLVNTLFDPLTGKIFYFDEGYAYVRGPWFWMLYVSAVFYMLYGIIYLVRYRKLVGQMQFAAVMAMFVLMPIAVGVQFFQPNALIEMFEVVN